MTRRHHLDKIPERKLDIVPATQRLSTLVLEYFPFSGELTNISDDSGFYSNNFQMVTVKVV